MLARVPIMSAPVARDTLVLEGVLFCLPIVLPGSSPQARRGGSGQRASGRYRPQR